MKIPKDHRAAEVLHGVLVLYDLTERVLPAAIQAMPTPPEDEAQRELLRLSARALGVATEFDLRDYYRLGVASFLIRGFDPVADTAEFGRELIPRIKAGAIEIDERGPAVAPTR